MAYNTYTLGHSYQSQSPTWQSSAFSATGTLSPPVSLVGSQALGLNGGQILGGSSLGLKTNYYPPTTLTPQFSFHAKPYTPTSSPLPTSSYVPITSSFPNYSLTSLQSTLPNNDIHTTNYSNFPISRQINPTITTTSTNTTNLLSSYNQNLLASQPTPEINRNLLGAPPGARPQPLDLPTDTQLVFHAKTPLDRKPRNKIGLSNKLEPQRVSLEDFELIEVIGKGGFGKVYKVIRKGRPLKLYAMKVMDKSAFISGNLLDSLSSERSLLGKLKHPYIVGLKWAFQNRERAFLVMNYLPGGSLTTHLQHSPGFRFDENRTRFYTAQIILALEYLHSHDIQYRDMKTDNVVLDAAGNAHLIDLGLAHPGKEDGWRFFGADNYYLSPEMLTGLPFTCSNDFWMLGIMVYLMLTGDWPWKGTTAAEVHTKVLYQPLANPHGVSNEGCDFLQRVLKKEKATRLRNASDSKVHAWFYPINWNLLMAKKVTPPFKPAVNDERIPSSQRLNLSFCAGPSQSIYLDNFTFAEGEFSRSFAIPYLDTNANKS